MEKIDSFRGEYYFLSNFYEVPVTYEGMTFSSNEAAFQAMKSTSPKVRMEFCQLNPSEAKHHGRMITLRKDWEEVKLKIMTDLVRAKFEQHEDLRQKLLATGDAYLEEGNTWGDRIWGTVNGAGANHLGQILMQIREELRAYEHEKEY